jgi:predicted nucleic acid-binding protein
LNYIDSSVVLAAILAEDRAPPDAFWQEDGITSRLLQYEVMNRLNAYNADAGRFAAARDLIAGLTLVELSPLVLERALEPWPMPVRTLDALHLATALYLTEQRAPITLATYDHRMAEAAQAVGLRVIEPG